MWSIDDILTGATTPSQSGLYIPQSSRSDIPTIKRYRVIYRTLMSLGGALPALEMQSKRSTLPTHCSYIHIYACVCVCVCEAHVKGLKPIN